MSDPHDTGVNPPFDVVRDNSMSKSELYEYHLSQWTLEKFYDLYPEARPATTAATARARTLKLTRSPGPARSKPQAARCACSNGGTGYGLHGNTFEATSMSMIATATLQDKTYGVDFGSLDRGIERAPNGIVVNQDEIATSRWPSKL